MNKKLKFSLISLAILTEGVILLFKMKYKMFTNVRDSMKAILHHNID